MKKSIFFITSLLYAPFILAQVGINTTTPKSTLHVNGSFQVTSELNVGGTENTTGDPGILNEFIISKGNGNAPIWGTLADLNVPQEAGLLMKTTNQSLTANTQTIITFNSQAPSNGNFAVKDGDTFKIIQPGFYQISAFIHYSGSGTSLTVLEKIDVNNTATRISNITTNGVSLAYDNVTTTVYLNANEKVRLRGRYSVASTVANANLNLQYFGN